MIGVTERVVRVSVIAQVNSYLSGMDKVAQKSRESRTEAERLIARLEAQQRAFTTTGRTMMVAGGLVAAGLTLAVAKAAEFDQQMSAVEAATHAGVGEMKQLRQASLDAAQGTKFSATQAAGAVEELSKAGIKTKDIIGGGLTGALNLAAAGEMDVAEAAGVASTTLQQFGLDGSKASHVADVLAAGAGKAMGDVSDLSQALSQSGTVAAQFGISLDETVGTLAAFASKGMLGSDAGTSFRTMLLRLANPTGQAADEMKKLGLNAYDAQGKFVGMSAFAGQLQHGLSKLTQEQRNASLSIIFGQDAIRAANILYSEGAKGISNWTDEVNDTGYAADTASKRLDNLRGDLTKMKTAFDNALIGVGDAGQGPLRVVVQGVTGVVNAFNQLPEAGQGAIFIIGGVTSAITLAGGAALIGVPKIVAFKAALIDLGYSASGVNRAATSASRAITTISKVGTVAAVAGTAAYGIDALAKSISEKLLPSAEQVSNKFTTAKTGVELFAAALYKEGLNTSGASRYLANLGKELDAVGKSTFWQRDDISSQAYSVIKQIGDTARTNLPQAQAEFRNLARDGNLTDKQLRIMIKTVPELRDALLAQAEATGGAKSTQDLLNLALGKSKSSTDDSSTAAKTAADAYQEQADKVNSVTDALIQLIQQLNQSNSDQQSAIAANARFVQGLTEISAAVKDHGASLDQSTAAGSKNADMLAGLAGDAQAAAEAQYKVDQQTMSSKDAADKYSSTLASQRQKFIDSAVAAGFNKDQVKALADEVFKLPSAKDIKVLVDDSDAWARIHNLTKAQWMTLHVRVDGSAAGVGNFGMVARAGGGILPGPPSSTDNMLVHAATGEFITKASQVAIPENRRALEYMNAGGVIRGYAMGGFVEPTYAHRTSVTVTAPSSTADASAPQVQVSFVNPVVRDLQADAWAAAQVVGANL